MIRCTHCAIDEYKLVDVKKDDSVKFYTDTPFKMAAVQATLSSAKKLGVGKESHQDNASVENVSS